MTPGPLDDYPRTVVLKDGAHVTIRPMTAADRPAVDALDPRLPLDADAAVIVATDGGRVVGASVLARRGEAGTVRLALEETYSGRRLGTWMLLDLVHLAGAFGLVRLEARPEPDAAAYRAALRRLDFVEDEPGVLVKRLHVGWPDF